jgi:hypothetical protein
LPDHFGGLGRHHVLRPGRLHGEDGLVRRVGRERQPLELRRGPAHAAVQHNPDQPCERIRAIAGTADRSRQGRNEASKWITLALPILEDLIECVFLQQNAQAHVLLVPAMCLEQPFISYLALRGGRCLQLGFGRTGMIEQV